MHKRYECVARAIHTHIHMNTNIHIDSKIVDRNANRTTALVIIITVIMTRNNKKKRLKYSKKNNTEAMAYS